MLKQLQCYKLYATLTAIFFERRSNLVTCRKWQM